MIFIVGRALDTYFTEEMLPAVSLPVLLPALLFIRGWCPLVVVATCQSGGNGLLWFMTDGTLRHGYPTVEEGTHD